MLFVVMLFTTRQGKYFYHAVLVDCTEMCFAAKENFLANSYPCSKCGIIPKNREKLDVCQCCDNLMMSGKFG